MSELLYLFQNSENFSTKHFKYFNVYENLLKKFRNKNVTFVEIGVSNGGSLQVWKNYFSKESKIIGIDINRECLKFQKDNIKIYIGSQSNEVFWSNFFKKVGPVDIIIDDGGHTNEQQIVTTINCIPKINDGGILIVEDVHSSYMRRFCNPSKYSFINFAKKEIDDVNSTFPGLNKKNFSLNKYIYSIEFFESIVAFKIDRTKCFKNFKINNKGIYHGIKDLRYSNKFILSKITGSKLIKLLIDKFKQFKLKKYFK
jgi:23S rRNA U2552 (ribose-2'-O)-methylase RlmE/FtsJ